MICTSIMPDSSEGKSQIRRWESCLHSEYAQMQEQNSLIIKKTTEEVSRDLMAKLGVGGALYSALLYCKILKIDPNAIMSVFWASLRVRKEMKFFGGADS